MSGSEPLKTIERIVKALGEERALALLEDAIHIHRNGGMPVDDGSRKRTKGGTFFKLVKDRVTSKERWWIFIVTRSPKAKEKTKPASPDWEALEPPAEELPAAQKGIATKVKLTIIGKPGKIIEKGSVVITSLQASKTPSLPKGLPKPPEEPTTWLVFIAKKQWDKVRDVIANTPDDKLIVEGYPTFDRRLGKNGGTLTLYAQMVTTRSIQQNKRQVK